MSSKPGQDASGELGPMLNPAYWDGLMVGDGQPIEHEPDVWQAPEARAVSRFARRALRSHLAVAPTYFPRQIYRKGQVFNPDHHAPGTLTLFDTEYLFQNYPSPSFNPSDFASLEVPVAPNTLPETISSGIEGRIYCRDKELHLLYVRSLHWGIVTPMKERNTLVSTYVKMISNDSEPEVADVSGPLHIHSVPLTIGKVHRRPLAERDRIERTNILHVCTAGLSKQDRLSRVRDFISRFAAGRAYLD